MRISQRTVVVLVGLFFVAIITPGCRTTIATIPEPVIQFEVSEKLRERQPIDVAVLPVYSVPRDVPKVVPAIREQEKARLIRKRYSPISFEAIDGRLGAFPERRAVDINQIRGSFDEDAILYTSLDRWDPGAPRDPWEVVLSAHFILYDSRTGEPLWRCRIEDWTFMRVSSTNPGGDPEIESKIASELVQRAFQELPAKDSRP